MKRLLSLGLVLATTAAAAAFAADRLAYRDVRALVDGIDEGRGRFKDALDGQLKRSIMRGPSGEVNVDHFLDDFEKNIGVLKDRLKPDYSAGREVGAVLHQASAIDAYFRRQPAGTKGDSEWTRLAADLQSLARAYGAAFPLAEGATVRRSTDREVAVALEAVARGSEEMKKSLDADLKKDTALAKPARQAIVAEAGLLSKDAKALRGRVEDGTPSSSEAEGLLARAAKLQATLDAHPSPSSAKAWAGVAGGLKTVAEAYGDSWPSRR